MPEDDAPPIREFKDRGTIGSKGAEAAQASESLPLRLVAGGAEGRRPPPPLGPAFVAPLFHLESLPEEDQGEWLRAMHFLLLLIRHNRTLPEIDLLTERVFDRATRHREKVEVIVKSGAEELIEMGERSGRQEDILDVLRFRFGQAPDVFGTTVQSVKEAARLSELLRSAATCGSLDEFQAALRQ